MRIRRGGLRAILLAIMVAAMAASTAIPVSADLQPGPWPRFGAERVGTNDIQPGPWPK